MKAKFLWASLLLFAGITACTDDAIETQTGNSSKGEGTPAYLTIAFNSNANSTRAVSDENTGDWDGDEEDSGHHNTGTDNENKVNTALIVVSPTGTESVGFAKNYTAGTDGIQDEGEGHGVSGIQVEVGTYNVLVVINPVSSIFSLVAGVDEDALNAGITDATNVKNLYQKLLAGNYNYTASEGTPDNYVNAANSIGNTSFMMANKSEVEVTLTEANASQASAARVTVDAERVLSKITFRPNSNLTNTDDSKDNIYKVEVPIGTTVEAEVVEGVLSTATSEIVKMNKAKDAFVPAENAHEVYAYYTLEEGVRTFQGVYGIIDNAQQNVSGQDYPVFTRLTPKSQEDYTAETSTETKKTWYVAKETDGTAGFSLKDEEASLTFIPKEGSDDAAVTKKTWYVKLEGYALTNLSKKVNYVRHIGAGTTSTIDENNAFGTLNGGNYLLTPYWAEKNAVTFDEETGKFEGSPATTTWFYNDLAAVSIESEAITPATQSPYAIDWTKLTYFKALPTTEDGEQDVTGSGSQHGSPLEGIGNFMDYCFENSTVDTKQVHGLSTGIAFLGRIYQNEECTTPIDDLYMYAEHNFESINDIVEAYNGNVSMAITDLAKKETDGTPISYEELKAANITKYQGNVCYYYTTNIKHYDDQQADVSGIMEFAVMRNNIYSLSVTNINKIGDPFIDATPGVVNESKQTYLDVMVKIVPWIVRYNDIEF